MTIRARSMLIVLIVKMHNVILTQITPGSGLNDLQFCFSRIPQTTYLPNEAGFPIANYEHEINPRIFGSTLAAVIHPGQCGNAEAAATALKTVINASQGKARQEGLYGRRGPPQKASTTKSE